MGGKTERLDKALSSWHCHGTRAAASPDTSLSSMNLALKHGDNERKTPYLGKLLAWTCCFPGLSFWGLQALMCGWLGISRAKEESDLSVGRVKPDGAFLSFFLLLIKVDPSLIAAGANLPVFWLFLAYSWDFLRFFDWFSFISIIVTVNKIKTPKVIKMWRLLGCSIRHLLPFSVN